MTFKEQMERYREGTATPEERREVEAEIEKYEALSDYAVDQMEEELSGPGTADAGASEGGSSEKDRPEGGRSKAGRPERGRSKADRPEGGRSKAGRPERGRSKADSPRPVLSRAEEKGVGEIRKSVNRRIRRTVLATLALAAVAVFAVSVLCQVLFYNPNKGHLEKVEVYGQFACDAAIFTELHSPGYYTGWARAVPSGAGSYQLLIRQSSRFDREESNLSLRLARGRVRGAETHTGGFIPNDVARPDNILESFWQFPDVNVFWMKNGRYSYEDEEGKEHFEQNPERRGYQMDALRELPASAWVSSYFTFREDLPMEEFEALYRTWCLAEDDFEVTYVAIRDMEDGGDILGFSPYGSSIWVEPGAEPEQYPHLFFGSGAAEGENLARMWEAHFKELLDYMSTRTQFLKAMADVNGIDPYTYRTALSYIEENGMQVYGVLVQGKAAAVLRFAGQEFVDGMDVEDVKLSVLGS